MVVVRAWERGRNGNCYLMEIEFQLFQDEKVLEIAQQCEYT